MASQAMLHVLLLVLDLGGTFVFAVSGAMVAVRHRLDVFGVLVRADAGGVQPNCTLSIEIEPPSMPSTGKLTASPASLAPSTYSSGR